MTATANSGDRRSPKEIVFDASAGAAAGAIAATFVCPLDVIKTRLQVHGLPEMNASGPRGSVILVSLQNIVRNEGMKGLYRGLTPTLTALLPNWANIVKVLACDIQRDFKSFAFPLDKEMVYFTVYGHLKELLHSYGRFHNPQNAFSLKFEGRKDQLTIASNMIAAAGAGAATSITTNPLWVVKTRLQTQGMRQGVVPYKNIFSALRRIAHEEGFRGWYSGLLPSLAGISHVAIQFPAYERIKFYLAKQKNKSCDELNSWEVAIASSVSKVVASVSTYPHEVIRSRLQEQGQVRNTEQQYEGVIDCIKKLLRKEGIPGFYRGCATNLLRTTPSAVITFTSYEMIHKFLLRVSPPDDNKPNPKSGGGKENVRPGENNTLHRSVNSSNVRTNLVGVANI
ncbi:mitochondrial carrier protein [Striga asiatica]|uniref:Mitochondrial carrier protein n=1 Tax=Striga asiatica TaxID=4170 RepID=A0A5A7QJ05_STRAF|nr:mitochondrial carrier protein [Striga asiatica]